MEFQNIDEHVLAMIEMASREPPMPISSDDVLGWVGSLSNHDFFSSVGLRIARKYRAGTVNYSVCDSIMNDLWSVLVGHLEEHALPSPFYEIYIAFDAGEYHRMADYSDVPERDYTVPMIDNILRNFP
ncbi:hypothetical protein QA648_24430 (plasmid) [Rhizobium sp. CB3171]|uniref:hypothetical protein n=1 Tax=Rhizobium sp. CB3171 TaxID=3039157 RepID=UPI0024B1F319|nr:hypothetical protein [Rhizobium sp. CB3171]WFU06265.1 hypothetical protein QA648_24430 [Rhizobium sp. CB3171]